MKTYRSSSSEETKRLGYKIAKETRNSKLETRNWRKGALVFALQGELGAGKTTFVQGFLRGLGIKRRSASPTFIIFRRFRIGRKSLVVSRQSFRNVYHVDAYRIKKPRELLALGFKEILSDPQNIVLIEWAENIKRILPKETTWLRFAHGKKQNERTIGG